MIPRPAALTPAEGPADPPSSRPRAGVLGGRVHAYRFDPALGPQRLAVPGLEAVPIAPDTVVQWAFYADGPSAVHAPHAALAVAVDVRFDDGSRLGAEPRLRDRYGFAPDPDAQFAAAWSMPEQWNADAVQLEAWAGRSGAVEVVLGTESLVDSNAGEVTGFVEVVVGTRGPDPGPSPSDLVDTRRGTHSGSRFSRGNTIPITARPHGFCFLTPATDAADSRWPYRWSVHDDPQGRRLEAVQFSHQPSPWIGDRGVLQLMPFLGAPVSSRSGRRRWIEPGTETARPHAYSAVLRARDDGGLRLEVTATDHGGAFRATAADPDALTGFVIDQLTDAGHLEFSPGGSFSGWIPEGRAEWGDPPRTYFAGRALAPAASGMLGDDGRPRVAGFVAAAGELEVRVSQSFVSVEQARRNLDQELPAERAFEDLREGLRAEWDALLGAVAIPALEPHERPFRGLADDEDRARLASALYRLHLYPNRAAENAGTAASPQWVFANPMVPKGSEGPPVQAGNLFVNNGYWDTYRTAWPAFALLDPDASGAMLDGLLEQWRQGGYMARWSAPGYVDCMVGTSSDQIFADADRWGVPFAREDAFTSAWKNACEPSADPRRGRKGIGRARFTGYVANEVPEGMSWSLENAVSDDAVARFASRLAAIAEDPARYRAFARYFGNRSRSYRVLFDPEHGFFRGRGVDGAFADGPFDPRVWGGDNVETNAWGMSVTAVHDGPGLAALYGGPAGLRAHLDRLFAEPETAHEAFGGAYGAVIHEQREARAQRSGMCALSNQPAHHIPWMHVFGDAPWRAGELVHGLAERLFAGAVVGQGFPGDEDNGEMSMWWLWAALGLYPLVLASGELRIGSPLHDDVSVRRSGGGLLRVRSHRRSPGARYLTGARLNGAALRRPVLDVDALQGDADLELHFTDDAAEASASPLWRGSPVPVPWRPDLTGATGAAVGSVPNPAALFDDGASGSVTELSSGDWAGWRFPEPRRVSDATVTAGEDTAAGLIWEASDDGRAWTPVATTHAEALSADRTTPFSFAEPVATAMLRVRALAPVSLRQLELFDLD
ncbi:glycoside hydrolase domain-containing protein [Glycomyces mayteni]|uniref:Glycoside hydrolase domain-containing protein n=1 Tax=Glycomyces mayteni TaxID=543887 RepID=A0ABW2D5U8_9ACTN|nr:GH92 family glycosyl hydrolase [Glycomyces mayteni]